MAFGPHKWPVPQEALSPAFRCFQRLAVVAHLQFQRARFPNDAETASAVDKHQFSNRLSLAWASHSLRLQFPSKYFVTSCIGFGFHQDKGQLQPRLSDGDPAIANRCRWRPTFHTPSHKIRSGASQTGAGDQKRRHGDPNSASRMLPACHARVLYCSISPPPRAEG